MPTSTKDDANTVLQQKQSINMATTVKLLYRNGNLLRLGGILLVFTMYWHGFQFRRDHNLLYELDSMARTASRKNNRTLVIVMGNLLGDEDAWNSMQRNLLDVNSADLALAIGTHDKTSSLLRRAKYTWEYPEFPDWTQALELVAKNDTTWQDMMKYPSRGGVFVGGRLQHWELTDASVLWIRWFISQQIQHLHLTDKYDRFVVTRSEYDYLCTHDLTQLEENYIWVPQGDEVNGITDRHVIVPANKILSILEFDSEVIEHFKHPEHPINPQKITKSKWEKDGNWQLIQQFPRVMYSIPRDEDPTEYRKSLLTCSWQKLQRTAKSLFQFE